MSLENVALEGIILFRGCMTCNAEPVLFSLIKPNRKYTILTIPGQEVVLKRRYPDKINEDARFVFFDHSFSIEDIIRDVCAKQSTFCIFDSIDVSINRHGVDETAALLHRLKGLVNLRHAERKVRVGGQVIYVPDANDDLDDSDPDDDLNL
uniref:Elongator complex protein 5 n=1 Tax=Heterorhabditis bacteriophora TaxID=37862 RepID=A0A1I7XD80_HETBA